MSHVGVPAKVRQNNDRGKAIHENEAEMNEQATVIAEDVRLRILRDPDVILEDPAVMRALIAANERAMGHNIVDLRGIAMERLEARLGRLEDTHRSVIAAAYENLSGMNQVHRAIMAFLEPTEFEAFLSCLATDVADILNLGAVRLVLEAHDADSLAKPDSEVLALVRPGFVADYVSQGRTVRHVTLRRATEMTGAVFGDPADWVGSEACIFLDFGEDRLPGMLAFASDNQHHFSPNQGTDLLSFMGGVLERTIHRWLP